MRNFRTFLKEMKIKKSTYQYFIDLDEKDFDKVDRILLKTDWVYIDTMKGLRFEHEKEWKEALDLIKKNGVKVKKSGITKEKTPKSII